MLRKLKWGQRNRLELRCKIKKYEYSLISLYISLQYFKNLLTGFRYGNDIIPISEEDKKNMGYQNPGKVLQVLGFSKQENVSFADNSV